MSQKLFIFVIFCLSLMFAAEDLNLTVNIVMDADTGWPVKVTISGYSPLEKAYMGISLYPYNTESPETDGTHEVVTIEQGNIYREFDIGREMYDGSFEVAIWQKKVPKVDCTLEYCYWCKINGFHLEELLLYKSGLLTQLNGY